MDKIDNSYEVFDECNPVWIKFYADDETNWNEVLEEMDTYYQRYFSCLLACDVIGFCRD